MIDLGVLIGEVAYPNLLITLNGDLGAGKTTLTKGIAKGLGIEEIVNSPTFTIMKIHEGRLTLYHMDVYRITNAFEDFELEEYFEDDGVCVVEWAEMVDCLLPVDRINVSIKDLGSDRRKFMIEANNEKDTKACDLISYVKNKFIKKA